MFKLGSPVKIKTQAWLEFVISLKIMIELKLMGTKSLGLAWLSLIN